MNKRILLFFKLTSLREKSSRKDRSEAIRSPIPNNFLYVHLFFIVYYLWCTIKNHSIVIEGRNKGMFTP